MKLIRYYRSYKVTLGILKINDAHQPIYTLELPWRDNKTDMSCIPPGKYKVVPYSSTKYPNVWEIKDVPGRSAILFHIGNYPGDSKGCILAGFGVEPVQPMVTSSGKAIELMRALLGKGEHELEIINL